MNCFSLASTIFSKSLLKLDLLYLSEKVVHGYKCYKVAIIAIDMIILINHKNCTCYNTSLV